MTILAVGDEPESFSNFFTGNTHTLSKDPGQRGGVSGSTTGTTRWELAIGSVSECWVRAWFYPSSNVSTTVPLLALYNSSTTKDAFRLLNYSASSPSPIRFQYNSSGTTYTNIGNDLRFPVDEADGLELVIYFKRGSSGVLRVWLNGILFYNESGAYNTVDSTWDTVRFYSAGTTATRWGGIIVADENLVNFALDHLSPSGAGTHSQWTGSAANLADATGAPAVDTATDINTNATGQRSTFAYDNADTIGTGREISAVAVSSRGLIESGSTPTTCTLVSRLSGTDYSHSSFGFGTTAANNTQLFPLDPAGNAWTETNINAVEYGALSG